MFKNEVNSLTNANLMMSEQKKKEKRRKIAFLRAVLRVRDVHPPHGQEKHFDLFKAITPLLILHCHLVLAKSRKWVYYPKALLCNCVLVYL